MGEVKAPNVPRPRGPSRDCDGTNFDRRCEIQEEITRLLKFVDRQVVREFPMTTITAFSHDVAEYADRTMIEKACAWLYDYNRRQAEVYGAKAVMSAREFTVDVDEFRKAMENGYKNNNT